MLAAAAANCIGVVSLLLWIAAVVLVVWGVVSLFRGAILAGIVLIVVGFLVGPGGVSLIC